MDTVQTAVTAPLPRPEPLPFHRAMVDYLKAEEADLWKWFASTARRQEQAEAIRLDLLRSTYRMERATQSKLYEMADAVLARYGLSVPVTFYQTQMGNGMNAALAYLPGEAHLILGGPVLSVLSEAELKALLAHELAHFVFFEEWEGDFLVATELLRALSNDAAAAPPHQESYRLFNLYTEVFADRGACWLTGDATAAIATLLKVETGLSEVSAESYLRQADEIFAKCKVQAEQLTHPEPYIRARALKLWSEQGESVQAEIERMIEGPLSVQRLDLLGQKKASAVTRRLLDGLIAPAWFRSEAVLAHARQFFEDFAPPVRTDGEQTLVDDVRKCDESLQRYLCYVMLDFVTVDRDLTETALATALLLSRRLELEAFFTEIAMKELGLGKKQFARIEREAEQLVARANEVTTSA